jgi:hypothetical protein
VRISRSAILLSLFRHPDNDNYPDDAVMPMSVVQSWFRGASSLCRVL